MTRRTLIIVLSFVVGVAGAVGIASPVVAAPQRSVTLTASPAAVEDGGRITFSGRATRSPKGSRILIERRVGRAWKVSTSVRTRTAKGAFKVSLTMSGTGRRTYRAVAAKTRTLKAASSPARVVEVRATRPTSPPVAVPVPVPSPAQTPAVGARSFTSFAVTPAEVVAGGSVTVSGTISSTPVDSRVDIQMSSGGSWQSIAAVRTSGDGRFTSSAVVESAPGNVTIRAVAEAAGALPALTSSARTIVVKPAPEEEPTAGTVDHLFRLVGAEDPVTQSVARGQANVSVSSDGRYVSYIEQDSATGTATIRLLDRQTDDTTDVLSVDRDEYQLDDAALSADGQWMAVSTRAPLGIPRDDADALSLYLWSRATGEFQLIDESGNAASITDDGRFVTYSGGSGVRRWDRTDGTSESTPGFFGVAGIPSSSADGRYVVFTSISPDVVTEPTYEHCERDAVSDYEVCDGYVVYLWDTQTDDLSVVSKAAVGGPADGPSTEPSISRDGRWITFVSSATDLVAGGTQRQAVYRFDRATGSSVVVAELTFAQHDRSYASASVSDDGRYVAYHRRPDPQQGGLGDVLVWDGAANASILVGEGATEYRPLQRIAADGLSLVFRSRATDDDRGVHGDFYRWTRTDARR